MIKKFTVILLSSTLVAAADAEKFPSPMDQEEGEPCIKGTTICDFKNGQCCLLLIDGVENMAKDFDNLDYKTWCADSTKSEVTLNKGPGTTWKFNCKIQPEAPKKIATGAVKTIQNAVLIGATGALIFN